MSSFQSFVVALSDGVRDAGISEGRDLLREDAKYAGDQVGSRELAGSQLGNGVTVCLLHN